MKMNRQAVSMFAGFLTGAVAAVAVSTALGAAEVYESRSQASISWKTDFEWTEARLTISGPAGEASWSVGPGGPLTLGVATIQKWAESKSAGLDGAYGYEWSFTPRLSDDEIENRARARELEGRSVGSFEAAQELPKSSGTFRIEGGSIVGAGTVVSERPATKDVLHYDDVIITGSLCVGFDCINGESFGYCTEKLKENNLQLCFEDTSIGTFPSNDWRIQFNDTTSGGASYFTIWDTDAGRRPFTIEAGAPAHSLYVKDSGRVGLGTSIPYVALHVVDGNTPTMRLDQDSSSGWAPQRWDVAGNEMNFYIRDVTNGSKMSFRIQPGAPSDTLSLRSDGKVGVGTWSPAAKLEIEATGEPASVLLDRTDGGQWYLTSTADGSFTIGTSASEGDELLILDAMGNLTTSGTVNGVSDRAAKTDFSSVDTSAILDAVAELEISEWRLVRDPVGVRHIGPTAQDFRSGFGLGADDRHISYSDMSGVALAAIQALSSRLIEREREIEDLSRRLAELEKVISALN